MRLRRRGFVDTQYPSNTLIVGLTVVVLGVMSFELEAAEVKSSPIQKVSETPCDRKAEFEPEGRHGQRLHRIKGDPSKSCRERSDLWMCLYEVTLRDFCPQILMTRCDTSPVEFGVPAEGHDQSRL